MPRKPVITRLAPEQRAYIERLLREDRLTLDEMLAAIGEKFSAVPARSTLHRYQIGIKRLTERLREQAEVARVVVAEVGENPDERNGEMLVQTIIALANDVALRTSEREDVNVEEVRKLARAVKDTIDARSKSFKGRQEIEQAARQRVLREQRDKLDALGKTGAIDKDVLEQVIKAAYDV